MTYKLFGDKAILIEWPKKIDEKILKDIIRFKQNVLSHKRKEIEDCIIGYNSLSLIYLDTIPDFETEKKDLTSLYSEEHSTIHSANYCWKIPVCYNTQFGIDLESISKKIKLPIDEIIRLHSQTIYTVYFIGFLPGFLYLGGLDEQLIIDRKSDPRLEIAKGSVAIGGSQTGVYPMNSAGGWNIIGKSPISFFDLINENPCFAKSGDKIQFAPITLADFEQLEIDINRGEYKLLKTPLND